MKVGQVKDGMAALMFLVALGLALTRRITQPLLVLGLVVGFLVDAFFTLNPDWHCRETDGGWPVWVLRFQLIAFVLLIVIYGK